MPFKKGCKPRRVANEPWTEGCAAELYKLFILPLLKYKPALTTIKEWQETLFHTEHRQVKQYLVVKGFMIPGLLRVAPNKPVQGVGYRRVLAGEHIYIRTDESQPDVIDVEILAGPGRRDSVYLLNLSQWNSIRPNLVDMEEENLWNGTRQ